jgi:hypothetical protein
MKYERFNGTILHKNRIHGVASLLIFLQKTLLKHEHRTICFSLISGSALTVCI